MNYNAGQLTLRQRTHHGLEFTLNYTYAKSLTNSSGNYGTPNVSGSDGAYQDGYNGNADYGPSGMDIRHSLNFVGVYELPFGHGRAHGGSVESFCRRCIWGMEDLGLGVSVFRISHHYQRPGPEQYKQFRTVARKPLQKSGCP